MDPSEIAAHQANVLEQRLWETERAVEQLTERLGTSQLEVEKYKGKYEALNAAYKELHNQWFSSDPLTDYYVGADDVY